MKKLLLLIPVFLVISILSCRQEKYIPNHADIESLANAAIEKYINMNNVHVPVHHCSFILSIDADRLPYKNYLETLELYGFNKPIVVDSTRIDWKKFDLKKAQIVSGNSPKIYDLNLERPRQTVDYNTDNKIIDSLNLYDQRFFYVPVKKEWTEKQIEAQTEIYSKRYFTFLTKYEEIIWHLSSPVFSNDGNYALIGIDRTYSGCVYLFRKEKEHWIFKMVLSQWMM